MRGTKDPGQAVDRLAMKLGGTVEPGSMRGRRTVRFRAGSPLEDQVIVEERVPRALLRLVLLARHKMDMSTEEIRDAMRLTRFVDTGKAHETTLMKSVIWQGGG